MPNMEELISRISRTFADGPADEIWILKFDQDYAYGQLILSRDAQNLCIFAVTDRKFTVQRMLRVSGHTDHLLGEN